MITRFFSVVLWLVAGHAAVGGLYWLLLQVPESNALMLGLSALLVLVAVYLLGLVQVAGWRILGAGDSFGRAIAEGLRRAWLVVFPLAVFLVFWWVSGAGQDWWGAHAGEIDAWFIASLGWTNTGWVHRTADYILAFIRYGLGVALSVSLLAAIAAVGAGGIGAGWWLRGALGWRYLLVVVAALIAGCALPWYGVYWRPTSLPPTWVQPAFAAVKLFVLFLVGNVAWAFILLKAPRPPASA